MTNRWSGRGPIQTPPMRRWRKSVGGAGWVNNATSGRKRPRRLEEPQGRGGGFGSAIANGRVIKRRKKSVIQNKKGGIAVTPPLEETGMLMAVTPPQEDNDKASATTLQDEEAAITPQGPVKTPRRPADTNWSTNTPTTPSSPQKRIQLRTPTSSQRRGWNFEVILPLRPQLNHPPPSSSPPKHQLLPLRRQQLPSTPLASSAPEKHRLPPPPPRRQQLPFSPTPSQELFTLPTPSSEDEILYAPIPGNILHIDLPTPARTYIADPTTSFPGPRPAPPMFLPADPCQHCQEMARDYEYTPCGHGGCKWCWYEMWESAQVRECGGKDYAVVACRICGVDVVELVAGGEKWIVRGEVVRPVATQRRGRRYRWNPYGSPEPR